MVLDLDIRDIPSLVNLMVLPFQSMSTLLVDGEVFVDVEQVVDRLVVTLLCQLYSESYWITLVGCYPYY